MPFISSKSWLWITTRSQFSPPASWTCDDYECVPIIVNRLTRETLRLHANHLTNLPNDLGELDTLEELTLHGNPLPKQILDDPDLISVLKAIRKQQPVDPEYKKEIKAIKKAFFSKEFMDVKGDKIYGFIDMITDDFGK